MNIRVYVFASEVCGACEATIRPMLQQMRIEFWTRGIPFIYIEHSKDPATGRPRNVLRKLMPVFAYRGLCGTPMIVITNPPYPARMIVAAKANDEDMRNQIVFQVCSAILEHMISDKERRWSFLVRLWKQSRETSNFPYSVLDYILKEYYKGEAQRRFQMRITGVL